MVDSKGLIVKDRPEGGVTGHKVLYTKNHVPIKNLEEIIREVKPSVIIGELLNVNTFCMVEKYMFFNGCCSSM
jgi:hypothetical protein